MSATTWNGGGMGGGMGGGIALPALTPMVKRLMIGLGAVWVVQMLLPSGLSQGLLSLFGLDPTDWFAFPLFLPVWQLVTCLLYTSPSPRDQRGSRMPSSA